MSKRGAVPQIDGRADAGKLTKVMIEMRLVIVAARKRHVSPVNLRGVFDASDYLGESANPAEDLRADADFGTEDIGEPPRAEAGRVGERRQATRAASRIDDREC